MTFRRLVAMAALTVLAAACAGGGGTSPAPTSSPESTQAGGTTASPAPTGATTSVFDLAPGDCFNLTAQDVVEDVQAVPCAELHGYELYAALNHPAGSGEPFPGDSQIGGYAETECVNRFEPFVGRPYEQSELFIYYLVPSESTWSAGDREVLCAVYLQDGQLEGSMEGSGR